MTAARLPYPPALPGHIIEAAVRMALAEDLGQAGDITSQATIGPDATAVARINAREPGIICGLDCALAAFSMIGDGLVVEPFVLDGDSVEARTAILEVSGNARRVLAAERTALNFMTHMSGIATLTRRFADAVAHTPAHICCTRKTTPGLRALEKYAVRCGGGYNHRFGLDDAILIKDNHIAVAGSVAEAVAAARAFAGHLVAIEVEVDTLAQLSEALDAGAEAILLDNMSNAMLRDAVALAAGRAKLEASGNVTIERVASIAETGVDYISTSRITMAATPLDLGLDIAIKG
ncbi:carboxylating nicotinate-nucleotide diphosphorylase [Pelagibacterium xiamenense]|uniref:carboxylating nicotinate-nucleotide diphosphorylase n=1 Tax=Pelagibacterium xiamenense TaxID=2901140 RepID=UPI001E552DEE|nr:carboxylating nicotinate-nucleotide diphosphorylase [Pelagibacterium xiamenense]MCD7059620.1 carboxylating nicotinate-nucleotide diphosphorylase [Pelagibacterium xiamenense]